MIENTELIEKREELKRRLAAHEYKSLVGMIATKINLILQKATRSEPLPFWLGIVMMVAIISLLGLLPSIITGGTIFDYNRDFLRFLVVGFLLVFFIAVETNLSKMFALYQAHLLDSLESVTDLVEIQNWLDATFSRNSIKKQLLYGLVVSIVSVLLLGDLNSMITNKPNFGLFITISNWVLTILAGSYFYILHKSFFPSGRFRQYQIKLNKANPSSSEILDHISSFFNYTLYTIAILLAIVTFIIVYFFGWTISNIILLALFVWGPTVVVFAGNQYTISEIIARAKWETLNKIQMQIEELQEKEPILSEETLAHIDKLMDYYDRIEATKNSALDIRAGLNFLNSLLLPLLAFIVANGEKISKFFFR